MPKMTTREMLHDLNENYPEEYRQIFYLMASGIIIALVISIILVIRWCTA